MWTTVLLLLFLSARVGGQQADTDALCDLYRLATSASSGLSSWTTDCNSKDAITGIYATTACSGASSTSWSGLACSGSRVTKLDLSNGNAGIDLTGASIPTTFGNMDSLTKLWMYKNSLVGSIPTELGRLTKLTSVWIAQQSITGTIPTELGLLTKVSYLDFDTTSLSSTIPTEISGCLSVTYLDLGRTSLSGTLPTELFTITTIKKLYLNKASYSGTLPTSISLLTALQYLTLTGSSFMSGNLPTQLGLLTGLTYLDLSSAPWTGTIPTHLGLLASAKELYLSSTSLSGGIPTELGNLASLTALWLSNSQVSGVVPQQLCTSALSAAASPGSLRVSSVPSLTCYAPCFTAFATFATTTFKDSTLPMCTPSGQPTGQSSGHPSGQPSGSPTTKAVRYSQYPTGKPSSKRTLAPTVMPTVFVLIDANSWGGGVMIIMFWIFVLWILIRLMGAAWVESRKKESSLLVVGANWCCCCCSALCLALCARWCCRRRRRDEDLNSDAKVYADAVPAASKEGSVALLVVGQDEHEGDGEAKGWNEYQPMDQEKDARANSIKPPHSAKAARPIPPSFLAQETSAEVQIDSPPSLLPSLLPGLDQSSNAVNISGDDRLQTKAEAEAEAEPESPESPSRAYRGRSRRMRRNEDSRQSSTRREGGNGPSTREERREQAKVKRVAETTAKVSSLLQGLGPEELARLCASPEDLQKRLAEALDGRNDSPTQVIDSGGQPQPQQLELEPVVLGARRTQQELQNLKLSHNLGDQLLEAEMAERQEEAHRKLQERLHRNARAPSEEQGGASEEGEKR